MITPTLQTETGLFSFHNRIGGMDEVGRGALAGPVTVGIAILSADNHKNFPAGLADSKLISATKRQALAPLVRQWLDDYALGWSSAQEVDSLGIIGALALAGRRALAQVDARGQLPELVLLDGSHDWLSPPPADLFSSSDIVRDENHQFASFPQVKTKVKADMNCAIVTAASILAKVARDELLAQLPDPGYGFAQNKGYGSKTHIRALEELGPSTYHRRSWHLPGLAAQ